MKKSLTIINLLVLCAMVIGAVSAPSYAAFPAKNVPIIMYHKVDGWTPSTYFVSLRNFRYHAFFLQDQGYTAVDLDDLYDHVKGIRELPAKPVIITADDGYTNIYEHALPLLAERGLFGVSNAGPTNYFGDSEPNRMYNTWDIAAEYYATHMIWPEVTALYNGGWSIVGHGQLHKALASMTDAEKAGEVASHHVLATKAGIPIPNFYAYPFGSSDANFIQRLKNDGYLGALNASGNMETTTRLEADPNQLFLIRRYQVNRDDTLATFAGYVGGTVPVKPVLTVTTVGNGFVQISPDQPYYNTGTVVNLTATPEPGYTFSAWSGGLTGSTNPTTVTMDATKTVTATFVNAGTMPFFDGFESAGTTHGGWTAPTGATASATAFYTGAYSLRLAGSTGTTTITKAQSTVGYSTIHVKYDRTFVNTASVTMVADWSVDGTTWNTLETVTIASNTIYNPWVSKDFTLPAGANNNAGFRIRFRTTAGAATNYVYIDNVEITYPVAPRPAISPVPETSATNVGINAFLNWTAGRAATSHDVYFGTAASPPFIGNQTGAIFDATMNANTTYYWRINEKNATGTTTGTVWSFTTAAAPGQATAPNPADAANANIPVTLSWTAGSGATSHDVYFGTAASPPFIANQGSTTYTPTLAPNTTYYWRIDEKGLGGTTTGIVWSFTTTNTPIFVAAGTGVSGTAAITVPWPTHQVGDVGLLFIESTGGQAANLTTPAGFVNVTNSPQSTGTGTVGTRLTVYWCRATSSSMTSPVVTAPGNHAYGRILTFRNVISTGDPWDVTAGGIKATASTTTTFGTVTTTVNNDLIVLAASRDNSSTAQAWSAWTNANLSGITEQSDGGTTAGNGGGIGVATGVKATAGAIGSSTATVTSSVDGHMTIALKPATGGSPPPGPASNPVPSTGATNVSLTQDLSWSAGSGVATRDVYFGTVNPPVTKVITDGTVLTYDTGTMATSTTYYWRVDEKNTGGTTTGAVWSFGTVPPPPAPASSPTPTNGATNVSRTQDLSWSAGSGVATRDVYFGTVNPPVTKVITDGTVLTYDTGTMATSTTYYWRVDEKNTGGTTTGAVWSFGTVPPPPAPASSPTPTNGATNVSRTQDLSWSAGSGVATRDVYFGTVNPPVTKVITDGTVLTYDTGTMATSTTYYWRVDEKNTGGTTTGAVWSFGTVPPPPAPASSPTPTNGATNVSRTQDLSWSAGSGVATRDVYFGTVNPPVTKVITDGTVLTYDTGTMATSTTYYWRVDEKNTGGTTTGAVWSFGTVPPPPAPASSPTPTNGATNVSRTQDLSWSAGSGVATRDVYFGTVNPPVTKVITDGTVLTYDTGTMTNNKTYYWRVDEKNTGGTTTGTVWSFATIASVPNVVGSAQADANSAIIGAGLVVGTITPQCSDTVAAGNVISQDPTAGTQANVGSAVNLVISSGQPSVPDVTGQAQATAIANINAVANISYGSSTTECSNTVDAGDVISQSSVGTVACGTVVNLVISSGQPSVPNVVGQTQAEAIAAIGGVANISYGSSTTECSNTVDAGNVISQSATGTVTCGTVVNLVISSGQPSVPDVTGQAQATAIANINAVANISYGSSTTQCSDTVDAGNVISQSATGTVTCGTVVNLVISSGQPSVPDVTGQAQATAIANINAVANISYGSSTTECSNTVDAGDVISQSSVGTVACGTVVNLVISSGQPSVPNVVGQTQAEAIAAIGGVANISYGSSTTECSNTVDAGNVISQSATGTVTCGTVVNLVISSGQPSVPDVTGQAQATAIANINAVANISYGSSTTQCSDTVDAGNVISQSATGTVTCGTVVNLVISSGQPSVPDVTGQAQATAIANINAVANISYGSSTTECSDTVDAGDVISQSATGTVTCGTVVNLVISSGQPSVPDVTGQAQATAIANINAVANISYGSSTTECSNTVTAGNVISQSVTGITTCGTVVNLVISSGQPSVPDVTGQAQATAIANINAVANISYGSSTTECSNTVTAGNVISQSVTGITTCGTVVNLVISSGQPSVPDVTGQAQATAIANINAVANISYGSSTTECSNTVTAGNVISQSATGTVTCGTVVNLVISSGQPSVPDVTGQAQATAIANINAVANISYGSSTTECSDTVAAGNVISQSVTGITTCGTVVNLVISSGQPSVPNVVGSTQAEAIAAIGGVANISYGSSTTECSDTVEAGDVISQSSTGTVTCGTVVNLVISSGQPTVPNVVGSTQAEAIAAIGGVANISYGSSTTQCSDTVDAGDVISQSATGIVTCGTVVNLVISSGQPSVPDVTGQAQATAIANINAVANISYGSSTTQCSDTVDAGNVISQSATGTVNCGTVVNLVISSGQPSVPDVTGQAQATAIANINAVANISYGSSTTECSDTVDAGDVISQSATGIVTCGTVVNLVISSGQPSVPDVTGQAQATAIANINAVANISYGSSTTECSDTVDAGDVISQSATGTVNCGTVVNLVISSGQPTVPNVVGSTQAEAIAAIGGVANISYGSSTTECSDTVEAGDVISQSATGIVNCGTVVDLVISSGQPSVPDVTGQAEATAIANINAVANISYGSSTTQYSDTVPAGDVISQSVTGTVPCGTVVDLVVSLGKQIVSLAEDFNDNERSAMWRMTSYDPEKTRVSEYTQRLNLRAAGQMDITASCVGHWKLNDNAANTTVLDSSGTNHNGTASRNTNLLAVADGINGAFRFNGTSDYVAVQTIGTGSYTKVAWINLELSTSPYSHNILSGGGNQAFWAPYQWSNKLSAGHNGIYNQVQDSVSLQLGTWYFAALTYNSSTNTLTLYKNGAVVSTGSTTTPSAPSALTIGKYSSYYFKGMIDNVMLFNRVLTGDEITALYNNSNGTETLPTYTTGSNEFSANGWNVDVNDNFQAKVDFHYSSVSSPAAWVGMTIENDQDNYISITAGANGSSPYFEYEKVVDGVVTSEETARASNDGTLYISYDKALDELYLSYTGYGAANAWQTITGLLNGSWSLKPLSISLGGGSDGSSVDNDQAYLDNFAASGSFLGWPPATDVDNNGFIDWADVMVIAENWLDTGSTPADIDGDGTVNFADFAELGLAW